MRIQVVPNWSCGGYTVGLEQGDKEFVFDYHASPGRAAQIESDFRQALAADAELDKTRFVELTGTNVRLNHEIGELKDQVARNGFGINTRDARIRVLESDLEAARELAAGRYRCADRWLEKYYKLRGDRAKLIAGADEHTL